MGLTAILGYKIDRQGDKGIHLSTMFESCLLRVTLLMDESST